MTSYTHRITNSTSGKLLSEGVPAVNGIFEHLTVLRVLIEGLADNNERGLWLTEVQGLPSVPRISPFDLIYLDKEQRVVEVVELLPAGDQPLFREPAVSALVLPFQTISATETRVGDQLAIISAQAEDKPPGEQSEAAVAESSAASVPLRATKPFAKALPAVQEPLIAPATPVLADRSAPEKPCPALTVHEVVLPEERIPAPSQRVANAGVEGRKANVKKPKGPGARKERRQAARAQKKKEDAEVARQRRTEAYLAAADLPASFMPAPLPQTVSQAASTRSTVEIFSAKTPDVALPQASISAAAAVQTPPAASAPSAKKAPERGPMMAMVNRVLRWLNPSAIDVEQRDSIRMPAKDLVAYVGSEGEQTKLEVGDISSSGVYLRTGERWEPGSKVALTLQRNGPLADTPEGHVEVEANTVRHGKDGVGLAFALPQGMHLDLWESAASGEAAHNGPDYIVHEMRLAQGLGLIRSLCPEAVEKASSMLRKDFSSVRIRDSLRLLELADKMLAKRAGRDALRAPAGLVLRILEMGSWASEPWTQELWAGLLVTSATADGNDQTNVELVETLSQLAPVHLRILELASARCDESAASGAAEMPTFTIRELTKLLDLSNQTKTLRSVGEMSERGLMTPAKRPLSDSADDNARTSVTALGMELHARCHGGFYA